MADEMGVVCGDDCRWKGVSLVLAAALTGTFVLMAVKLVDARHEAAAWRQEAYFHANKAK